jgi:hypothetical protein
MFFLQKPPNSGYSASVVDAVNRAPRFGPSRIETAGRARCGRVTMEKTTEKTTEKARFDRGVLEWVWQ